MSLTNSKINPGEIVASLREVTVTYDGYQTRSLSRVSLNVLRGEVLGVLGPKGAGKSTVLGLLAGRMRPTEGTVKVFGRSPRRGAAKARVGYLADAGGSGRPRGFFQRLFSAKSNSQQGAGASARLTQAVLGNRDLLVLDEPFAGLGPAERVEMTALIRELSGRGKTIILGSDSLMDINELCQRFAVFHEGKLQAMGTLPELLVGGSAIRFLPAVLPRETVERVLKVLREEIGVEARATPSGVGAGFPDAPPENIRNQMLTPLTGTAEAKLSSLNSKPEGEIDHDKLAELTKRRDNE